MGAVLQENTPAHQPLLALQRNNEFSFKVKILFWFNFHRLIIYSQNQKYIWKHKSNSNEEVIMFVLICVGGITYFKQRQQEKSRNKIDSSLLLFLNFFIWLLLILK